MNGPQWAEWVNPNIHKCASLKHKRYISGKYQEHIRAHVWAGMGWPDFVLHNQSFAGTCCRNTSRAKVDCEFVGSWLTLHEINVPSPIKSSAARLIPWIIHAEHQTNTRGPQAKRPRSPCCGGAMNSACGWRACQVGSACSAVSAAMMRATALTTAPMRRPAWI
jgi:hypothetical protein